jgi:hypothetical protein
VVFEVGAGLPLPVLPEGFFPAGTPNSSMNTRGFRTVLIEGTVGTRQRDHARNHGQTERAALFIELIKPTDAEERAP